MSRKVVVTGLGAITPIGENVQETWANALKGVSGVHALENDWVEQYDLAVRIGATAPTPSEEAVSRVQAKRLDPSGQFSVAAAREAWNDAGFSGDNADTSDEVDPTRVGVAFGTGIGGVWTLLDAWDTMQAKGARRVKPMTVPMLMPNGNASSVSMEFKARACAITPVSACASGTEAFYQGLNLIREGKADVVIVGGAESAIHPVTIAAFNSMQALSRRNDDPQAASRPFDIDRDGFVMGEGAGACILESEEHAKLAAPRSTPSSPVRVSARTRTTSRLRPSEMRVARRALCGSPWSRVISSPPTSSTSTRTRPPRPWVTSRRPVPCAPRSVPRWTTWPSRPPSP